MPLGVFCGFLHPAGLECHATTRIIRRGGNRDATSITGIRHASTRAETLTIETRLHRNGDEPPETPWGIWTILWASLCLIAGCPSYKDARSGTYQQVGVSTNGRRQNLEIDFFRYGDNARAIFRFFEPDVVDGDPFGEQVFCMRTKANTFRSEERPQFDLSILSDQNLRFIRGGRLTGSFVDSSTMEISLHHGSDTLVDTRRLERIRREPEPRCNAITRKYIHPIFTLPDDEPNTLPEGVDDEIENPVLTVQWVGVRVVSEGGRAGPRFVRTSDTSRRWIRLGGDHANHYDRDRRSFRGDTYLWLDPPDEDIRMQGTGTRYAIGHVVVIDDRQRDSEDTFDWNRDREPIVATALQRGTRPNAPEAADGSGKALLFVEDKLSDIGETLRERRFTGLEEMASNDDLADEHFYIVDVDVSFRQNEVLKIHLEDFLRNPGAREITLKATDRFLGSPPRFLPRLPPLEATN